MLHKSRDTYYILLIALFLSAISVHPSSAQTQAYPFKQFPLPQDLPSIYYMYQDYQGYIWLGTVEGLYRFDGINYTFYSGRDAHDGLGREVITYIFEDSSNHLWIGARSGLYRYNPQKKDFDKYALGDETYAYYVHQENDSCFLVQSIHGMYLFYPFSSRWDKLDVGIDDDKIFYAIKGRNDDLWIGTDHKVRKYNLDKRTSKDYNLPGLPSGQKGDKITVHYLFLDSRDQLWINTWFKGVAKLDTHTGQMESFDTLKSNPDKYLLDLFNSSMTEDVEGNIWLASPYKGINIYHPATGSISHILKGVDYGFGLVGAGLTIRSDREKNIWVKSDRALHYLSRKSPVPQLISEPHVIIEEGMFIHFVKPEFALIGTFFGLYGINLETKHVILLNDAIHLPSTHDAEQQSVTDVIDDKHGMLWMTSPQGLRKVKYTNDEKKDTEFRLSKLYPTRSDFWPSRILQSVDSTIIVKGRSNTKVLATFNMRSGIYDYHTFPDSMLINQVALYKKDTLLVCIRNKGLYYYSLSAKTLTFIPWIFKDQDINIQKPVFYDIATLENGEYALSTENYGLILFDPGEKIFQRIDIASVAKTNLVFTVDEDAHHNLWIQASNQLLFYDWQAKVISKVNVAGSFKGYSPNYFMHDGKEMYTTFEGGLYRVELNKLFTKTEKPNLYLQDIKAGDRSLDWFTTDRIRLAYTDNFISYEFTGLDYDNPQGISYWYKIPEINDHWVSLQNHTSISLGRLSPGTYHFSLKASNDAGLWSEEIHAPEIRIAPPFWSKWWFVLSLAVIGGSVIAYLLHLRKMKKDAEVKLRNQIARDLHDDIGSTLSGIKIFSTIASDMAEENKDLSSLLHQIRDKSDTMMHSMSDIVWSINPAYDSLHDMMVRLKQYMSEMLESQNIDVVYTSHCDLKHIKLDLRHRKDLYLALKEIINNAAKHAECHQFIFDISKQKGNIVFSIKDDGIGINEETNISGNGLNNIASRIKQIEGTMVRESSSGNGTSYEISVGIV